MSDDHVTLPDEDPTPDTPATAPTETGAPVVAPDPIRPACADCGTSVEINQQYCLACGAPTAFAVPLRARKSTPALIAASLLALGIGGASMIYAATKEDTKQTSVASVPTDGTSPTIQTLPTFPTGTNPFPTGSGTVTVPTFSTFTTATTFTANTTYTTTYTTTVTRTTGTTSPTTNYDDSDDWPYQNETRYTLVMRSYKSLLDAQDYCDTLQSRNFSCGVLNSDFYGSLKTGWFVVFHSNYTTKAKADAALANIKSTYPSAYVRKIEV